MITSSAINRYARLVRENGARVAAQLQSSGVALDEIVARIQVLAREVIASPTRSMNEVELVLLMTAMAEHSQPSVLQNLAILAERNEPSMAWVSAYAKELSRSLHATARPLPSLAPTHLVRGWRRTSWSPTAPQTLVASSHEDGTPVVELPTQPSGRLNNQQKNYEAPFVQTCANDSLEEAS
jgi:hypothetical protein